MQTLKQLIFQFHWRNDNSIGFKEEEQGVPEGDQKQKKLPGYDTYIFWKYIP